MMGMLQSSTKVEVARAGRALREGGREGNWTEGNGREGRKGEKL